MERRQYDREFKVDAVKLSMQEGKKVTEVAAGIGIHENLLYQWRRLYQDNPTKSFLPDAEKEEMKQSISDRITKKIVTDALLKAIWYRKPSKGLIVHSDQGSQYASKEFRNIIQRFEFKQSMSGKGNCYDNTVAESFFHTFKTECVYPEVYSSKAEAKIDIFDYIEIFYNRQRRHSTINYLGPVDFEKRLDIARKVRVS